MENMESRSSAEAGVRGAHSVLQIGEDWRLAREAHRELQNAGMPRTNLLIVGTGSVTPIVLEMMWLQLREPIVRWRPGQQLELPAPGRAATLILHDINALTSDGQHSVLRWLDQTAGRVRVVSTTPVPLWPRVKAEAFSDALYYRLNTVCVDVSRKN